MTMPPSTTAWKLARYVGDMKDPDAPSRFWAECDPSDPELPDFEYRWLAASPSPEPDSQPEPVLRNDGWDQYRDEAGNPAFDGYDKPDSQPEDGGHDWFQFKGMTCCKLCGIIQRADGKNKPCPGIVKVGPREDSQPEDWKALVERVKLRLTLDEKEGFDHCCDSAPATFAELRGLLATITRLAQERDALQGDFNDCNSERARWRRVAERCETEKQAAEKERDAVRNAMAESCSELSGAPCPRAEAAEKERDEALGEFARAGMRQADQLLAARSRAEAAEQALNETYTDESGTVWTRPTAWAYYAVCRARDAKARAHTAAEQALAAEQARTIEWRERAHAGLANLAAREEELRRKTEALELIVHTYTEDSHGNMKTMPADYYQKLARTALQERTDNG